MVVLALATVSVVPAVSAAPVSQFHVAPGGRDTDPGTTGRPFATLERARDAVRELKMQEGRAPAGGVTVWVHGGVYRLSKSLELTEHDSGAAEAPVVYRAVSGETVRLMGGPLIPPGALHPVTDPEVLRRLDEAARGHVLQADLKALGLTDFGEPWPPSFTGYAGWPELFFDGRPMTLARWPNEGLARVAKVLAQGSVPRYGDTSNRPGSFVYEGDRPARWLHADEVYLNGYWCYKWFAECLRVGSIDPGNKTITFAAPARYGVGGPSGGDYYAFNLLEELDAPGEYYLDRKAGVLYFWPPEDLAGKELALSVLRAPLVVCRGASHIVLRGLTLESCCDTAVTITGGADNLVAGCTIRNTAGGAVTITGGSGHRVVSCDLYALGSTGVVMTGGDRAALAPCGHYAVNNHIHHFSRLVRSYAHAISLDGVGCRAAHNLIHDCVHEAMYFRGNDHVIEFNEIYAVCLEADDSGIIHTGRDWTWRGTVIRNNFFHDVTGGVSVGNMGVYLDDDGCGTTITGNVFCRVNSRPIFVGGGRDNTVENNVIVDCPRSIDVVDSYADAENKETFQKGLQAVPYREEPWRSRYPALANIMEDGPGLPKRNVVRRNLVCRAGPINLSAQATAMGTVADNLETTEDPGFVDAKHLNLALRDDSVVFHRIPGFQRIPFDQVGLYTDEYRPFLPAHAPWVEPEPGGFVGEALVSLGCRTPGAVIRYTLDGVEPTPASRRYTEPIRLSHTMTIKAAAYASGGEPGSRSRTVSAVFTQFRLGEGQGVPVSALNPLECSVHGELKRDISYGNAKLSLGGEEFATGLLTHPEATPEGGRAHVVYALNGELARARRFQAWVGIDGSAGNAGSATFAVEVRRAGQWQRLFESGILRGGQPPARVDVDISRADRLRLVVTDAGDNIYSDHAVWGGAVIR